MHFYSLSYDNLNYLLKYVKEHKKAAQIVIIFYSNWSNRSEDSWFDSSYGQTQRISKAANFDKFFDSNPFTYFH
jgi:hypothetical protein